MKKKLFSTKIKNSVHLFYSITIVLLVLFLGIGYSAFNSNLIVNDIAAEVRIDRDIRIKAFKISELSENVISNYENYNINNVSTSLRLPDSDSYGIFEVDIYNYGNVESGISKIESSNSNLKYEIIGYNVGDSLCDDVDTNKCSLGSKSSIRIRIGYADGVIATNQDLEVTLTFTFSPMHYISYYGIDDSDLPKKIIDGANYSQSLSVSDQRIKAMMNGVVLSIGVSDDYTYEDNVLKLKNVSGDLKIFDYQSIVVTPSANSYNVDSSGNFSFEYTVQNLNSYDISYSIVSGCDRFSVASNMENIDAKSTTKLSQAVSTSSSGKGTLIFNVLSPYAEDVVVETSAVVKGSVYMKVGDNLNENNPYLEGPILKKEIEKLSFVGDNEVPSNALGFWDVSYDENTNQVMAWYFDEDNNGLYELFIGYNSGSDIIPSVVYAKDGVALFSYLTNLKELNFEDSKGVNRFDTSEASNMQNMFFHLNVITSLDLSNFDTQKVTNMSAMFSECKQLVNLKLSNFDTRKVTQMNNMFYQCNNVKSLDVGNFDTSMVRNMSLMFFGCQSLVSLDVSNFSTSVVTNMSNMFYDCNKLLTLSITNFDTSNVTKMNGMFANCFELIELDVTSFDTSKVSDMNCMFLELHKLVVLDVSNFNTANVSNFQSMFYGCNSVKELNLSNFNTSKATNLNNMFYYCSNLSKLDIRNFDVSHLTTDNNNFLDCIDVELTIYVGNDGIESFVNTKLSAVGKNATVIRV